jgi:hypothetical protein
MNLKSMSKESRTIYKRLRKKQRKCDVLNVLITRTIATIMDINNDLRISRFGAPLLCA